MTTTTIEGKLIAVELDGSRLSAQALRQMAQTAERYRVALTVVAEARAYDPYTFALAVLDGRTVHEALVADVALVEAPTPPEVAISLMRVEARRELVKAALVLYDREQEARGHDCVAVAYQAWQAAEAAMYESVAMFRKLGGNEEG